MSSAIEVRDVTVAYPRAKTDQRLIALWRLSLTIAGGEFITVVGPSGCGKTTLLNCIAGLVKPTEGTVEVDGETVIGPGPDRAVVFQDYALFPWRTVWDNVHFGLEGRRGDVKEHDARIADAIKLVGLSGFERAYPRELSGGMRQRAGLARVRHPRRPGSLVV